VRWIVAARRLPVLRRPRAASVLAAAALALASCAPGALSTQSQRIAYDDPGDSCHPEVLALDSTGDFFGAQILTGAAIGAGVGALAGGLIGQNWQSALIGGATGAVLGGTTAYWSALQQQRMDQMALDARVAGDLTRENAAIDRTQYAFDRLTDCRFRQAAGVRAAYRAGRIDRAQAEGEMASIRTLAAGDLRLAQLIDQQIQGRGAQFATATENLGAPPPPPLPPRPAVVRRAAPLRLTPQPDSPSVATLAPRERVTVTGGRDGYALVQTGNGAQGYAAESDLAGPGARSVAVASHPTAAAATQSGDVRTLAGSNAARRDAFAQSVSVAQQAQAGGFQLAG
jgi:YMGG-like Gly-zipper